MATFNSGLNVTGEIDSPTITSIKSSISSLQSGLSGVSGDITTINGDINTINSEIDALQSSVSNINTINYATNVSGTNSILATLSPAPTSYIQGFLIRIRVVADNTGACTLNVNSLGVKTIQRQGTALVGGEWKTGDIVELVYDGTSFQVLNVVAAPLFVNRTTNSVGIDATSLTGKLTINNTAVGGISLDADSTLFNGRNARFPGRLIAGSAGTGFPTISYNGVPSSSTNNSFSRFVTAESWLLNFGNNSVFSVQYAGTDTAGTTFTPTNLLSVTTGGNIGIGTTSPNGRMTIQSGASTAAEITMRGNNGSAASEFFVGQGGDGQTYVHNRANTALYLGTNNLTRLTIAANGAATFNSTLSVSSDLFGTGILSSDRSVAEGGALRLRNLSKTGTACYDWYLFNMNSAYPPNGNGGSFQIWRYPSSGGSFSTTTWQDNAYLTHNGSCTIGGSLLVNSGISSNDVYSWGKFTSVYGLHVQANIQPPDSQGFHLGWNFDGGGGHTWFVNHRGGGAGAFKFSNISSANLSPTATVIATINSAGTYTASDYRKKKNIENLNDCSDKVLSLIPRKYELRFEPEYKTKIIGFLAHEVQEVVPEAVDGEKDAVDSDGTPIWQSLNYAALIPVLVGALKEQIYRINELEKLIKK